MKGFALGLTLKLRRKATRKSPSGSRNTRCSYSKVEIISLAFKWLIVLRSAIRTRDQTHRVAFAAS